MEPAVPERRKVGSGDWLGEKGWAATAMDLGQEVESSWFERWEGGMGRRVDTRSGYWAADWEWPGRQRLAGRGAARQLARRGAAALWIQGSSGEGRGRRSQARGGAGLAGARVARGGWRRGGVGVGRDGAGG